MLRFATRSTRPAPWEGARRAAPVQAGPSFIDDIAGRLEPTLRAAFLAAVERAAKVVSRNELAAQIQARVSSVAIADSIDWTTFQRGLEASVADVLGTAFGQGGEAGAARLGLRFDLVNPHAVNWARETSAKLVTEITETTRAALRETVTRAMSGGLPPQDAAEQIKGNIGLTSRQARAADAYRRGLDAAGKPPSLAEELTQRYRERLLEQRAEVIARTEVLGAANSGQQELWRQAIERGDLPVGTEKTWVATRGARTCPICTALDGATVLALDSFASGGTSLPTPPIHPLCRCTVSLKPINSKGPR